MNLTAGENSDIYQGDYSYDLYFYNDLENLRLPGVQESYFCLTVTVYSLTFLLGLLGNSLVIFAVCGDRKPRSVTSLFMVSLAVADLMFILVCTPYELVRYFRPHAEGGAPVCKLASFVDMLSAVASILNLTSISVERYMVIVHPMISRYWCTAGNTRKILPAVWALAILLSMPSIFVMDIEVISYHNNVTSVTFSHCYDSAIPEDKRLAYAIYQLTVMFLAPTLIMIICYTFVIYVLWLSSKQLKSMTSANCGSSNTISEEVESKRICLNPSGSVHTSISRSCHQRPRRNFHTVETLKARRQVMKMLITIVIGFLICWGPRLILRVVQQSQYLHFEHAPLMKVSFSLLPYIQSFLNPIIYGFMSKNFRRSIRAACRNYVCRNRERQICMGHRIHLSDYEMESRSTNGTLTTKMSLRTIESVSSDDN
ncbi:QRFP-like peptide receptor [Octopus sinensis]|uniref:QRFP-like peptide receptor n=1 Tax=Octopus sinensis TaxID=2607531 RepID=A0A6P7SVD7_9MOLL|nr:QRFP-like peptide receptor [Octopus sinensis]